MGHWNKKHWLTWTSFYRSWFSMKSRCKNKNDTSYKNYWARWIIYCDSWELFDNFYNDMYSSYFLWATIDRIDVNWNYCKENCRWATYKEQANNKRNNEIIEIHWVKKNLWEWLTYYWIDKNTYRTRINNWWNKIEAIITKAKKYNNIITFNWLSKTLSEWSKCIWIDYKTLYRRYYIKKYPLDKVFTKEKFDWKTIL